MLLGENVLVPGRNLITLCVCLKIAATTLVPILLLPGVNVEIK